jgi:hypothetical protein
MLSQAVKCSAIRRDGKPCKQQTQNQNRRCIYHQQNDTKETDPDDVSEIDQAIPLTSPHTHAHPHPQDEKESVTVNEYLVTMMRNENIKLREMCITYENELVRINIDKKELHKNVENYKATLDETLKCMDDMRIQHSKEIETKTTEKLVNDEEMTKYESKYQTIKMEFDAYRYNADQTRPGNNLRFFLY